MNKKLTIIIAVIAALSIVAVGVYAAVTIWSNEVSHTPIDPAAVLTTSNATPEIGEVVTWTATLDIPSSGIVVTFYLDGVSVGTDTTTSGIATYDYTVVSITPFIARASAEIT